MRRLRIQYNAPVVLTIVLMSLIVLVVDRLSGGWLTLALFSVYRAPLSHPLTYVRFVTHILGHASYSHYIANMMLLLVLGPPLEEKYGSVRLLGCILVTALCAGVVQFVLFPSSMLLGASGIVFMMIVLNSLAGMKEGFLPLTMIFVIALYLGGEVLDAVTKQDNISQMTHILGGLCGTVLGMKLGVKKNEASSS